MKKILLSSYNRLLILMVLVLLNYHSYATHVIGAELRYKWISGLTYEISVYLYGDCSSTSGAFGTLPSSRPQVCIYNGAASVATLTLNLPIPAAGTEVTPVCPDSLLWTTCTNISYPIPGIKKFVYTTTYTFPA